ncbi:MAG: hypothetical protein V4550_12410 [Gemmatimonadota bacterium]
MIPLIIGAIVALMGLAILADAWLPEDIPFGSDRRRRARTERSIPGEACIGIAVLCMAAALIGRDTWKYGTVAVIAGTVLFLLGGFANKRYLRDRIVNRGSLRRGEPGQSAPTPKPAPRPNGMPLQPKDNSKKTRS